MRMTCKLDPEQIFALALMGAMLIGVTAALVHQATSLPRYTELNLKRGDKIYVTDAFYGRCLDAEIVDKFIDNDGITHYIAEVYCNTNKYDKIRFDYTKYARNKYIERLRK